MIGPVGTWSGVSAGEVVGEVAEAGVVTSVLVSVVLVEKTVASHHALAWYELEKVVASHQAHAH